MINIIAIAHVYDGTNLTPSVFVKEYKTNKTASAALKKMRSVKCMFNSENGTWFKNKNNSLKCYNIYREILNGDVIRYIDYYICDTTTVNVKPDDMGGFVLIGTDLNDAINKICKICEKGVTYHGE